MRTDREPSSSWCRATLEQIDDLKREGVRGGVIIDYVVRRLVEYNVHSAMLEKSLSERILKMPTDLIARISYVADMAAKRWGIKTPALLSKSKDKLTAAARHYGVWASRMAMPEAALVDIGAVFYRDHSTVLHAINKIDERRHRDPVFKSDTDAFLARVKADLDSGTWSVL